MKFTILKIDRSLLLSMEPILSTSAGYQTSISDELEYFDSHPLVNWFVAIDETKIPIGFIRSFDQVDWSQCELFILPEPNRSLIVMELLNKFINNNTFDVGHRLRFDVLVSDNEINFCIKQLKLNQKSQTFFYYELDLVPTSLDFKNQLVNFSATEVADTLSHLHPVQLETVETWIQSKTIRVILSQGRVVAVAQIYNYGDSVEINRLATNLNFLRQGFAKNLIKNICHELSQNGVKKLFLKVESIRKPAIQLYENFGFKKNDSQTQIWYTKLY